MACGAVDSPRGAAQSGSMHLAYQRQLGASNAWNRTAGSGFRAGTEGRGGEENQRCIKDALQPERAWAPGMMDWLVWLVQVWCGWAAHPAASAGASFLG